MDSSTKPDDLSLETLQAGLPGLTAAWGQFLCEASQCCLEFHKHPKGIELKVMGIAENSFKVYWEGDVTDQLQNAWDDKQEMTEYGACGIAILLILKLTEFTVIRRARKGPGVDYWLGYKDAAFPFREAARLEVSGILNDGNVSTLKTRVNKKLKQTQTSDSTELPAFIAVVEFSNPHSYVVQK